MEDWLKCQLRTLVKYRQNENMFNICLQVIHYLFIWSTCTHQHHTTYWKLLNSDGFETAYNVRIKSYMFRMCNLANVWFHAYSVSGDIKRP